MMMMNPRRSHRKTKATEKSRDKVVNEELANIQATRAGVLLSTGTGTVLRPRGRGTW
jgi:hypothetical protein